MVANYSDIKIMDEKFLLMKHQSLTELENIT